MNMVVCLSIVTGCIRPFVCAATFPEITIRDKMGAMHLEINGWNRKSRLDTHLSKSNVNSFHNLAIKRCDALMNQDQSIQVAIDKQTVLTRKQN